MLNPEEIRFLCCIPPFACSEDDIIHKYFGQNAPKWIGEFTSDLLTFYLNLAKIIQDREENDTIVNGSLEKSHI